MATNPLSEQFKLAHRTIGLGARRTIAIAAHLEVRSVLHQAEGLLDRGLVDVLIGSYPRHTGIWPGKDVDVFAKLTKETIDTITPDAAFGLFQNVLVAEFGDRVEPQNRSIKVAYRPDRAPAQEFVTAAVETLGAANAPGPRDNFEFSVDVVPAVHFGERWGIPNRDVTTWTRQAAAERWMCTDPERLTLLSQELNGKHTIGGQGSYVPIVKSIRQIRRTHLGDLRPGGLFFELLVYEGCTQGEIDGNSWADRTASALAYIAARLSTITTTPLCDPALGQPYQPLPEARLLVHAASVFGQLASRAAQATKADQCPAAAAWREIFGPNSKANGPVFGLPPGCTADGKVMPSFSAPIADPLRGSDEPRGFGDG